MGRYDNFDNKKNIAKAQKKLNKMLRKQDQFQIDLAQKELDDELLFSNCHKMELPVGMSRLVFLFNDDKKVMRLADIIIPYKDLASCEITDNNNEFKKWYHDKYAFWFKLFKKNGEGYQCEFGERGILSNKVPKEWSQLMIRIQMIIDEQSRNENG